MRFRWLDRNSLVQSSSYKTKQRLPTTRTSNQGYLDIHTQEASPGITDPAIQGIKQDNTSPVPKPGTMLRQCNQEANLQF